MKRSGLLALLLAASPAFAVNPVQGWYGGIQLGVNYTPSTQYTFPTTFDRPVNFPDVQISPYFDLINLEVPAGTTLKLYYATMGQIAGQVGYRCNKFRVEGQLGYNNSPYNSLKINNVTLNINDQTIITRRGNNYTFDGATNTMYGMLNGYYDFIPSEPDANFAPYIGAGVGYAYLQNIFNISVTDTSLNNYDLKVTRSISTPAVQGIVGASYFMDDFTAFGLDFRYFVTTTKSQILNANAQILSVNLTFNGAFNLG